MRDCGELLNSLHIGEPGRHELLMVNSALVMEGADGVADSWPTTAALLVVDADAESQRAIRELALRFQYGAVSVQPLQHPSDAAQVLAQANSAVVDLVVLWRGHDPAVLDVLGFNTPGMRLLVHNLPAEPPIHSLRCGEDAMFDGFVSGQDDPLGSALKTFQMVASFRAPGTLSCMDYEDFLFVFDAGRPVEVFAIDPTVPGSDLTSWADVNVLSNGSDVVVVFDSRTGRLNSIKDVLSAVRGKASICQGAQPDLRYLGTKKYFREMGQSSVAHALHAPSGPSSTSP